MLCYYEAETLSYKRSKHLIIIFIQTTEDEKKEYFATLVIHRSGISYIPDPFSSLLLTPYCSQVLVQPVEQESDLCLE